MRFRFAICNTVLHDERTVGDARRLVKSLGRLLFRFTICIVPIVGTAELHRRAEVAKLLKAGRWICAGLAPTRDHVPARSAASAQPVGWKVRELTVAELAAREPLASNGLTETMIGRIERMQRGATPLELDAIERALGLPGLFDTVSRERVAADPPDALVRSSQDPATTFVRLPRPSFPQAADAPSSSPRS